MPAERTEVVVLLESPPLARAPGTEAAIASEQRAFRHELTARLRSADIGWRYRLVANGFSLSLPSSELPRLRTVPGVRDVLLAGSYAPHLSASPQQIGAPALWGQSLDTAGQGVKIGIIDSGIDAGHPFFDPTGYAMPAGFPKGQERFTTAKVIVARVFAPEERDCRERTRRVQDDDSSHGTHVAGIAAGNADTPAGGGRRVSGVAPRAYLGNYKVFVETSSGLSPNANSPAIVAAIEAAVADGMDVINFSGGEPEIEPSRDIVALALDAAAAAGVVPVVAAGNDYNDSARLGLVARQLRAQRSPWRRRDRRQPDDAETRRVLVRRTDDDLAEAEARRRRTRGRRTLVDLRRRLGGALGDEHGLASRHRGGRAPPAASPRVEGRAGQVRARPVGRRLDAEQSRVAGPRFQGGGVVALARADRPLLFARPRRSPSGCSRAGGRRRAPRPGGCRRRCWTWQVVAVRRGTPRGGTSRPALDGTVPGSAERRGLRRGRRHSGRRRRIRRASASR